MAEVNSEARSVNARILYWGPDGSGKTTNLHVIHAKLRPDHRGELQRVATRLDPTVHYEQLPIELGDVGGFRTRIRVVTAPGGTDQAPTRKQLLDQVDGVVFVADAQRDRLDENVASFEELRGALSAYGRSLEDVPLVVQYNKCDLSDPYTLEELHRKLEMRGAAAFEAVAERGQAVLPTLTTISKRVIRALRDRPEPNDPPPARPEAAVTQLLVHEAPPAEVAPPAEAPTTLEDALEREDGHPGADAAARAARSAEAVLEAFPVDVRPDATQPFVALASSPTGSLALEGAGPAERLPGGAVRIPLSLRDASGTTHVLTVTLAIDTGGDG